MQPVPAQQKKIEQAITITISALLSTKKSAAISVIGRFRGVFIFRICSGGRELRGCR
jgi:hypothetical protein